MKKFHCRELFDLFGKWEQLWEKMLCLENNTKASERFKNRGGQLLKEEKERNALKKRMSNLESTIMSLAQEFETKNGRLFCINGDSIVTIIRNKNDTHTAVSSI